MAPFLTHLVIGERVWAVLGGRPTCSDEYGAFLFGCLAPDVDKFCAGLEQGTTHFVAKDIENTFMWRRSQRFLDCPSDFLRAPYHLLDTREQAFVLGYLCHIATDEISARHTWSANGETPSAGRRLPHLDAILTVMDQRIWTMANDPQEVKSALSLTVIPEGTFVFAPQDCLAAMHRCVLPQVKQGGGLPTYLETVRRQRQWLRNGQVSDDRNDADVEIELIALKNEIEVDMLASERLVNAMALEPFVQEAVEHSLQCIEALKTEERKR